MSVTAKVLDQTHPDYDLESLTRRRALAEGGKSTRRLMKQLLPKMPNEPEKRHKDRLKRAVYLNYAGPICNFHASYLFSKPPRVDVPGAPGEWYLGDAENDLPGFVDDVDRKGSSWASFWRERLLDAFVGQSSYVWINLPRVDEERATRLDQEEAGDLNAYLVGLLPEEVIDWTESKTGQLETLMVRQITSRKEGPTAMRKQVTRWTWISPTEIRIWEWEERDGKKTPSPDDPVKQTAAIEHGLGRLPVVRLKLPKGFWLMEQLHDPTMATFYAENDLAWASYQTAHALLWVRSKWEQEKLTIGDGYVLQLFRDKEGEDEAGWLEIDGASHEVLRQRTQDLRQELYRVANQLALAGNGSASEAARSGESKLMDYQAVAIVAKEFASLVLPAMRQAIRLVSEARDDKALPTVTGLEGYKAVDAAAFLDAVTMAKPLVKSETFARETAKAIVRHTIGDSLDPDTVARIEEEIESADYSLDTHAPYQPPTLPKTGDDDDDEDDEG